MFFRCYVPKENMYRDLASVLASDRDLWSGLKKRNMDIERSLEEGILSRFASGEIVYDELNTITNSLRRMFTWDLAGKFLDDYFESLSSTIYTLLCERIPVFNKYACSETEFNKQLIHGVKTFRELVAMFSGEFSNKELTFVLNGFNSLHRWLNNGSCKKSSCNSCKPQEPVKESVKEPVPDPVTERVEKQEVKEKVDEAKQLDQMLNAFNADLRALMKKYPDIQVRYTLRKEKS